MTQVPTPEQISALPDEQIEAATQAWEQVSNTEQYLSGCDAVTRAVGDPAGLPELNSEVAALAALEQAVKDRFGGLPSREVKGLDSSARWAYLAHAHPDVISADQREALMAGWNAATAPSKSRDHERTYSRLRLTAMVLLVLSVGFTGAVVGPSWWLLVVGAVLVSLAMIGVWLRADAALRQGRAASYRFGLTILAAVQVGFASHWFAATGRPGSQGWDALLTLEPSVAVFVIGSPAIFAALLLIEALSILAQQPSKAPHFPLESLPPAYLTLGIAGAVCAVLSAGAAFFVHEVLWVLSIIVVLASLAMIRDWIHAPRDLTRPTGPRGTWASIMGTLALTPLAAAWVQAAIVLSWIYSPGQDIADPVAVGAMFGLPFVAVGLFTAAKMALARHLRAAGALTYTERDAAGERAPQTDEETNR